MKTAIIGGGGTGAAILYDLCRRGFPVTLFERGELTSGTTGRHHGQLHCGARYAMGDKQIARECMQESSILRRIAPHAIEFNQGLFVAVDEEDLQYTQQFIACCRDAGIPAEQISLDQAHALEPGLSDAILAAVRVPDGTIDPWRLAVSFFTAARQTGRASIRPFHEVRSFDPVSMTVTVEDRITKSILTESFDCIINAAGPWAGAAAASAGISLDVSPSPGTMTAVKGRLTDMVISRLHPAGDGDIIVPQRDLTIIGSTQRLTDDPDDLSVPNEDISFLLSSADAMFPGFSSQKYHTSWTAARPLLGAADTELNVRELSRDFSCIRHNDRVFSVIGGKATTLRAMGEACADAVCSSNGIESSCSTHLDALPNHRQWYHGRVYDR